ncbi:MAG: glucoamylase family protein [Polyangiaceae bacterium]
MTTGAAEAVVHGNAPCPGLSTTIAWDAPELLRGELLTVERLEQHAVELAHAHGTPSATAPRGALRERLTTARDGIHKAYGILMQSASKRREMTPAEEWLIDNSHIVDDQLREIEEDLPSGYLAKLPRLGQGPMRGYPRVYGLAVDFLRHTDARLDLDSLARMVHSYQTVEVLTIGELWAIPIMLRLGLLVNVGALAESEVSALDRARGDEWAQRILSAKSGKHVEREISALEELDYRPTVAFLVHLLRRLREHETHTQAALEWVEAECMRHGHPPEELTRRHHLRQAADQLSVGNTITSMRTIGALDWNEFFERASHVEAILRRDPSGAYARTDASTRDRCRHAVEDLARRGASDEREVAEQAISLASRGQPGGHGGLVAEYLIGPSRAELERIVRYRPRVRERLQRLLERRATAFYLACILVGTAALTCAAVAAVSPSTLAGALAIAAMALLPASEIAVSIVNALITLALPPRVLPKLDLKDGIPKELDTLVVIPALLTTKDGVRDLVAHLERRYLGNTDAGLRFGLLTDYTDHSELHRDDDAERLEEARRGIEALNERHPSSGRPRFFLLHRTRRENPSEGRAMGHERKRGKLEALNRLILGDGEPGFDVMTVEASYFAGVRFVITLDADTELPHEIGRRLVATIAHPLNQPIHDPSTGLVIAGHAIVQPRVSAAPTSGRASRWARIQAGNAGIDPYTTAVSDVYQDLFGEGSFVGKAIYDVRAFARALAGRVPDNSLLSHDLFEGLFARCALATDIEVFDAEPASYDVAAKRQHRWIRGDWQLLPWLGRTIPGERERTRSPLSALSRWKMIDNLRRSLLPVGLVALLLASWASGRRFALVALVILGSVLLVPMGLRILLALARRPPPGSSLARDLFGDLRQNAWQILLGLVLLLDRALLAFDAITRTLYRLYVSRRSLLEWQTMEQTAARNRADWNPRLLGGALAAALLLVFVAVAHRSVLPLAAPVLAVIASAPVLSRHLSAPLPRRSARGPALEPAERRELRVLGRRTWAFFDRFVTAEENWLPPDNWQSQPRGVIAHRTSPTNIGLYCLSCVAARDFGFIGITELDKRLADTLRTVGRLERHEGHVLNWYDTTTLRPLEPRYVSTVDNGNFAAYLWTLHHALLELSNAPVFNPDSLLAASDALHVQGASRGSANDRVRRELDRVREALPEDLPTALDALVRLERALDPQLRPTEPHSKPRRGHRGESSPQRIARGLLSSARSDIQSLAPWARSLPRAPRPLLEGPARDAFAEVSRVLVSARSPREIHRATRLALKHLKAVRALVDRGTGEVGSSRGRGRDQRSRAFLRELRADLRSSRDACATLLRSLEDTATRAMTTADEMSFGFLYDKGRGLFSIGYNVGAARLDGSHYDLLASEARVASLLAIAKGDVPVEHWFKLGRPRSAPRTGAVLLSWSGSMFEYLMPLLVTRSFEGTLLDETVNAAVAGQVRYGQSRGVPWGISESAYNLMDLSLTYQYRAFGVPGFGLKAGLADDLVVAPYATLLATLVRPDLAVANLRALAREGLEGEYGYYESIDFSPTHVPPGRRGVVVKTFMAHHQGMGLVALDNALNGAPMQRRFHRDARVQASELLLEERIPVGAPVVELRRVATQVPLAVEEELHHIEHVTLHQPGPERAHLIGHGDVSSIVTATGTGSLTWRGADVHRSREGTVLEKCGIFVFLRDTDTGEFWSAAHQPTCRKADRYVASMTPDRVEIHRRDGQIETSLEISVSAEHPAEVRRLTITNHGREPRNIEVTTYTEIVLAPRDADLAHRAFSSMFVETSAVSASETHGGSAGDATIALFARRRPRASGEAESWAMQTLTPEEGEWTGLEVDTSRAAFVGRGRDLAAPLALVSREPLSGTTGTVLDPALVLRRSIRLSPRSRARVALSTGMAGTRDDALLLAETYGSPSSIARTFQLGAADARVEMRHLGLTGLTADRCQKLLSAVLYPIHALRAEVDVGAMNGRGRDALWALGVSGDLPILLLRLDAPDFDQLLRDVLQAHEFWRHNGVTTDLVLLDEEPLGYNQPQHERALAILRSSSAAGRLDQRGGVFLRRAEQIPRESRAMLLACARAVLVASKGSLARQLRFAEPPAPPTKRSRRAAESRAGGEKERPRDVSGRRPRTRERTFDNELGGFVRDGKAYRVDVRGGARPPAPWCNVIANRDFGTVVSESGSMFTWCGNSQTHRLTPWSNEPISDPSGEIFLVREEDEGVVYSLTPSTSADPTPYEVEHGQGYSAFYHARRGLDLHLTVFVDAAAPVKICRVRLRNRGSRARTLTLLGAIEWVIGATRDKAWLTVATDADEDDAATVLLAHNPLSPFPSRRAFFAASRRATAWSCDRVEIFGRDGDRRRPRCLDGGALTGRVGTGLDPAAALLLGDVEVAPGAEVELVFALGEAADRVEALAIARRSVEPSNARAALERATIAWDEILGVVNVRTKATALDVLANRWLLYQSLGARVWARSAFYQSGGAFGFRDQLQDVMALFVARPALAREHIVRCASRQFTEGDAQHWWHPETGAGVRTTCSDDFLWLVYVTAAYVTATGDATLLDERVPFLVERPLADREHDLFSSPSATSDAETIYEHCVRALDRPRRSDRGLPLMGGGDWNDGMNAVGGEGRGESVWLAWFYARCLLDFAPIAAARGDLPRADRCRRLAAELGRAAEQFAWDGEWYRRAFFDDGTPLGSVTQKECKIDAIAQSWAVISGVADAGRAARAQKAAEHLLYREEDAMMLLFWPPFVESEPNPGYVQSYPAGLRENGGQYTHGVLWSALAATVQGDGDRAVELLEALNPIEHTKDAAGVARYAVEPYVVAADVYAASGLVGRGGWTWYTGSAAWMYRIFIEHVCGLRLENGALTFAPVIPRSWDRYDMTFQRGATVYRIHVENPDRLSSGACEVLLDGQPVLGGAVVIADDGRTHDVRVTLVGVERVKAHGRRSA